MAETKLSVMVKDEVEEMMALVNAYLKELWEELWPSLVELRSPKERREFYQAIDWQALKDRSEHAWALMTADAEALAQKEDARIAAANEAYREEAARDRAALRAEMEPFGGVQAVAGAELNTPLPLGRFGRG